MKTIGDRIKELRRGLSMSQGQLAEKLEITNQAVSKWENNFSQPDINLLPDLASVFGVSIDDLFEYTDEKFYEKIENMIDIQYEMTNHDFTKAEAFLLEKLKKNPNDYRANSKLGDLYLCYIENLRFKALDYGKKALDLKPNTKDDINTINRASLGAIYDWNVRNNHDLIDYYKRTLRARPENTRLYLYLLDNLIKDGRLEEARSYLEEAKKKKPDPIYACYSLAIREREEGFVSVYEDYLELSKNHEDDWRILFSIANVFSQNGSYDQAIDLWEKAFDAQEKPRYTDYYESIAQCYILMGKKEEAAKSYEKELDLLRDEWDISYGYFVDELKEKIEKLRS